MAQSIGIVSISGLIENVGILEVPDFQRNFSWQDTQIDDFHKDLMYSEKENIKHFIGTTILMKNQDIDNRDSYYIIDGQQRLTTIFMYVAILRDRIKKLECEPKIIRGEREIYPISTANQFIFADDDSSEVKFKSNSLISRFFYDYVLKENGRTPLPARGNSYTLDLIKAYVRIQSSIEKELVSIADEYERLIKLDKILRTILKNLQILRIDTFSLAESFNIFMTLNSRGLALGPSDLVKSLFMKYSNGPGNLESTRDNNEEIAAQWKEMTDSIGENGDPDQFLRHYLISKKLDKPVQAKIIFSEIEKLITSVKDLSLRKQEATNLLGEIVKLSTIYRQLLDPNRITDDEVIRDHCLNMNELLDSYRIVMLLILDPDLELEINQRRELTRLCEILSIRWGLTGGNRQDLENSFQEISKELRKSNLKYEEIHEKFVKLFPSDESVKAQFDLETNRPSYVRVVLHKINSITGNVYLLSGDPSKLHVEHVAPQKPTEEWINYLLPDMNVQDIASNYAMYSEFWGNKTILEKPINNQIKRKLFKVKCDGVSENGIKGYKDSLIGITNSLTSIDNWTTDLIKLRNEWIKECFIKIWSVEDLSREVKTFDEWRNSQAR